MSKVNIPHITITKGKRQNQYVLSSNHPFFKGEYVCFEESKDHISFRIPRLNQTRNLRKITRSKNIENWIYFSFNSDLAKMGRFNVDLEDSTEDEIVVYYDQNY